MSQLVTLFARPRFVTLPKEIQNEAIVKYGSFFKGGTRTIARGLTKEEEEYVLPDYLGVDPKDVMNWRKEVQNFWANLTRAIPIDNGLTLNITYDKIKQTINKVRVIGGEEKTEKVEVEIRIPENIEDFCIYQLCVQDDKVAITDDELRNKTSYDYYVLDPVKANQEKAREYQVQKKATQLYLQLTDGGQESSAVIDALTDYFKADLVALDAYPMETGMKELDTANKENAVKALADNFAERFLDAYNDDSLKVKAKINRMLDRGTIIKEGNSYFNEHNEEIAKNYDSLVRYLSSKSNTGNVAKLNAKLESSKEPKKETVK